MAKLSSKFGGNIVNRLALYAEKFRDPPVVKVGFLESATYPDGTSVPTVAAVNEFGAPSRGQPPRPYFRRMITEKKSSWGDAIVLNYKDTGRDINKTMDRMGQGMKGQLQQSIRDLRDPPLKPSTVKSKGFDKPLIDTGHMLNSVDYKVTRED